MTLYSPSATRKVRVDTCLLQHCFIVTEKQWLADNETTDKTTCVKKILKQVTNSAWYVVTLLLPRVRVCVDDLLYCTNVCVLNNRWITQQRQIIQKYFTHCICARWQQIFIDILTVLGYLS